MINSKRLNAADQSSQSNDKSLILKSAEYGKKPSISKKEDRTYIPSKPSHSASKRILKANRSLGNFKQPSTLKDSQTLIGKSEFKTKIECDLRMPGKKPQIIRKVKSIFSDIITTVKFDN